MKHFLPQNIDTTICVPRYNNLCHKLAISQCNKIPLQEFVQQGTHTTICVGLVHELQYIFMKIDRRKWWAGVTHKVVMETKECPDTWAWTYCTDVMCVWTQLLWYIRYY